MSRLFEYDIRKLLKEELENNFNSLIDLMRVERNDQTIPYPRSVVIDKFKYQYPEISIEITDSEFKTDEILDIDIDNNGEIFSIDISVVLRTQLNEISFYADCYIEALKRFFHGRDIDGFTWCEVKSTKQRELVDENSQVLKLCGVILEIRIN